MNKSLTRKKIGILHESVANLIRVLLLGIAFGVVLVKSEVARWEKIHAMFLFQEPDLYLIIGSAILVAMISMAILRKTSARSLTGQPIVYQPKPFHPGVIYGGFCFGAGWAITGVCPGPIYAQIGSGETRAWFTLLGALVGMYTYAWLKPRLPHGSTAVKPG